MVDTYVSASNAEVRTYPSFTNVPDGVIGTDPLDPPDDTYIWPTTHMVPTGGGETQIGVAYFDPIDVTTNPSPRLRLRMAGTATGGGYQVEPVLEFYPLSDPFNESALIGSYVFPYPHTWYVPGHGGPPGSYDMGTTQEVEYFIPLPVQTALASGGVACWIFVNGSTTGDGHIGIQVQEFRLALARTLTVAPPCHLYPRDDDQGVGSGAIWPPPSSSRPGSYY